MKYLSLKIDDQWAVLDEGTEIALEGNNPLFSDAGSKSYLFRLHVESNRHIFGTSDEIYGESYYKVIDGKRSTLYVMGIPVMTGKIALEDEVMMEDGYVAVNLVSGNLEFAQMIEGMNCRDVEQAEDVEVGYNYSKIIETRTLQDDCSIVENAQDVYTKTYELPAEFVVSRNKNKMRSNISNAYPEAKYCNIRTACVIDNEEDGSTTEILTPGFQNLINTGSRLKNGKERNQISAVVTDNLNILVYEAYRRNSGICFYVLYFIDCLMKTLGIYLKGNQMNNMEDFKRLAFVNMRCVVKGLEGSSETIDFYDAVPDIGGIEMPEIPYYNTSASAVRSIAIATSDNFPDIGVSDVIDALRNAFGARFLYDSQKGKLEIYLLKNILQDSSVIDVNCEVYDAVKVENRVDGFRLKYDYSEDDTNYFLPKRSNVTPVSEYSEIVRSIHAFDARLYVDSRNGNSYMVKVDSEADESGDEENLNPSLLEVGSYVSVSYGDCSEENFIEEVSIGFSPIINVDLNASESRGKIDAGGGDVDVEQTFGMLLDVDVKPGWKGIADFKKVKLKQGKTTINTSAGTAFRYYDLLGSNSDISDNAAWLPADKESAANSYDSGFMLGIMRGPGNASGIEYFDKDFDGEGNSRVAFTAGNYAFTSDSIDNCNRDFDYNGTGEGGVDYSGRFSLKLRARKYDKDGNPIKLYDGNGNEIIMDAARENRGLYDKFWKEYAYFTVNKKILRITCRMEIADIVAIDWTKRYRIGEHVGFIANYSYSVSTDGMSDVELDLYYI